MIRYGIIGPGIIARKFAKDIRMAKDSVLTAVASRSMDKAKAFGEEFNIPNCFGSYEDMVRSDLIDAVYVATPHTLHKGHSILAMKHGKHVICEKPISVNSYELEEMIKVAKENNVLLMEAMWTRFLPAIKHVKKIIESSELGTFKYADLEFGYELGEDYPDSGRLLNPNLAGGSILDLLVYPASIMFYLINKDIKEIAVESQVNDHGVDLDTVVEVTFEDDTIASLHSSIAQDLNNSGVIKLSEGDIIMKNTHHCQEMVIDGVNVSSPCMGEGFVDQIEAFTKTVLAGKLENDIMSYDETRKVMGLLDRVRKEVGIVYPTEKKESN